MHNHFKIIILFFFGFISVSYSQPLDTTKVPVGAFRVLKLEQPYDYKECKWFYVNTKLKRKEKFWAVYTDKDDSSEYPDETVRWFDSTGIYTGYSFGPDESRIPQKAKRQATILLPDSATIYWDYYWDYRIQAIDRQLPGAYYGLELRDSVAPIAEFDSLGNYVGMETMLYRDSLKLSESIRQYVKSIYKGYEITDIRKFADARNKPLFTRVELIQGVKHTTLRTCVYFNEEGKECIKPVKYNLVNYDPTW